MDTIKIGDKVTDSTGKYHGEVSKIYDRFTVGVTWAGGSVPTVERAVNLKKKGRDFSYLRNMSLNDLYAEYEKAEQDDDISLALHVMEVAEEIENVTEFDDEF